MDNLMYHFFEYDGIYHLHDKFYSLKAYGVHNKKRLPVKWLKEFSLYMAAGALVFHLGNDKWCSSLVSF
ncbi:hypothetical protein Gorai_013142, partial [Gossypium raimondii]|nr:hypothetical protein [Gossypium raimondii]